MPRGGKSYTVFLAPNDRLVVVMHLDKKIMVNFTVQYDILLNSKWLEVTRIDTCHGYAHRHKFSPKNKEIITAFPCKNYNEGFTEARRYITENYLRLHDNYLTQLERERL